jgi:hypothetical protein
VLGLCAGWKRIGQRCARGERRGRNGRHCPQPHCRIVPWSRTHQFLQSCLPSVLQPSLPVKLAGLRLSRKRPSDRLNGEMIMTITVN